VEPKYQQIAEELRQRLVSGELAAGRLLPSESALGAAYAASRVTVRRALELLKDEGLVDARQGFGWFAASATVEQSLGRLGTIEAQLEQSGRTSQRRVLDFRFVSARSHVRKVLGSERVLEVRRLNLVDGIPFARVTVWCPAALARGLSLADVERATFHDLLGVELGGATQTIGADALSAADADALGVPEGSPALVVERVTRSAGGSPVLLSEHVFPGHLTRFVVELTSVDRSVAPSGLRLVQ
jgi:GntR family transcriptional regulator